MMVVSYSRVLELELESCLLHVVCPCWKYLRPLAQTLLMDDWIVLEPVPLVAVKMAVLIQRPMC